MALTTLSVLDNLQISTLIDWNDVSRVRKISKGCYFMQDIEQLNVGIPMASKSIDVLEYRETFIGDDELVAEVQATAIVGGNLVVDLVPIGGNPVDYFREGSIMFGNSKQIQGKIVAAVAGQITVAPVSGSTVAQLNASFTVGNNVQAMGVTKKYRNSSRVEGINYFPEVQTNYLSLMREGAEWNRVDMHKARIESAGKYWVNGDITRTLDRMLKDIERTWLWGLPDWDPNNDYSRNGGVDWAIRNRGGIVSTFGALPTQGQFQDFLDNVADRRAGYIRLKKLYMGRKLYAHIMNNFTAGYIRQIDPQAPRTDAINENANKYLVGGHEVDLIHSLALFQERDFDNYPTAGVGMTGMKKEWSAYYIDQDPVETVGSGTVPAIEKLHFGSSPFYIGRSTGIGDCPVGMPTADGQLQNPDMYQVSTSAVDRSELNLMYHGGVNMVTGNFSGIFEASL